MKPMQFQIHAEWKERPYRKSVPITHNIIQSYATGFPVKKEETIILNAFDFMSALRMAQKRFPGATISIKNLTPPVPKTEEIPQEKK